MARFDDLDSVSHVREYCDSLGFTTALMGVHADVKHLPAIHSKYQEREDYTIYYRNLNTYL